MVRMHIIQPLVYVLLIRVGLVLTCEYFLFVVLLLALPYPGCEFFAEYKSNSHSGLNLFFNWSQSFISSDLLLSNPPPMIPDEMLSCNGASSHLPPGTRRSQAQIEEEHEFQHTTEHHHEDQ